MRTASQSGRGALRPLWGKRSDPEPRQHTVSQRSKTTTTEMRRFQTLRRSCTLEDVLERTLRNTKSAHRDAVSACQNPSTFANVVATGRLSIYPIFGSTCRSAHRFGRKRGAARLRMRAGSAETNTKTRERHDYTHSREPGAQVVANARGKPGTPRPARELYRQADGLQVYTLEEQRLFVYDGHPKSGQEDALLQDQRAQPKTTTVA